MEIKENDAEYASKRLRGIRILKSMKEAKGNYDTISDDDIGFCINNLTLFPDVVGFAEVVMHVVNKRYWSLVDQMPKNR